MLVSTSFALAPALLSSPFLYPGWLSTLAGIVGTLRGSFLMTPLGDQGKFMNYASIRVLADRGLCVTHERQLRPSISGVRLSGIA
jgi:hypothetical protein